MLPGTRLVPPFVVEEDEEVEFEEVFAVLFGDLMSVVFVQEVNPIQKALKKAIVKRFFIQ
jgi:hypothetical protein